MFKGLYLCMICVHIHLSILTHGSVESARRSFECHGIPYLAQLADIEHISVLPGLLPPFFAVYSLMVISIEKEISEMN